MHVSPVAHFSLALALFALLFSLSVAHPAAAPEVAKTDSTKENGHRPGHTIEHNGVIHRVCGTEKTSEHVVDAHKDLRALHKKKPNHRVMPRGQLVHEGDLWDVVEKEKRMSKRTATVGKGIVVETYVHFVSSTDQKDAYKPEDIASMIAEQVQPFSPFPPSTVNLHQPQAVLRLTFRALSLTQPTLLSTSRSAYTLILSRSMMPGPQTRTPQA